MSHAKSRLAVDLDEIERQLSQPAPQAQAPRRGDPLAELARIVGQDDPFRSILTQDASARPALRQPSAQAEAAHDFAPEALPAPQPAPIPVQRQAAPAYVPQQAYAPQDYADPSADYHLLADEREPAPRSRKGLIAVGALVGVAVVGVSGAMMLRSGASRTSGEPVVVQAERTPLKVQPQNPGGITVPDQNRQIYQPGAPEGQVRVVNREEQPIDVRSAAAASAPAPAGPSASALIGEPRKVRTVAVRPDGTLAAERAAAPAVAQPVTTSAIPASSTPALPPRRPQTEARTTPTPPPAATSRPAEAGPTPSRAAEAPRPQTPRVAAAQPAAEQPAPAASAARGNFVVQLSSSPSETDAKAKAGQLKQKFAEALGGRAPYVRSAEVNGNTTYRVRVGPMSRDDANTLCTRVKGSGGACIVAAN